MVDILKVNYRYDIYADVLLPEMGIPRSELCAIFKTLGYEKICEFCSLFCSSSTPYAILEDWIQENTKLTTPHTFLRQITIQTLVRVGARSNSVYFHYYVTNERGIPTGIQGLFPESLIRITKRIY